MFKSHARDLLGQYRIGPYQLNAEGARLVIEANEALPQEYFAHLDFPISDFWHRYFWSKMQILPPRRFDEVLDVCCGTGTVCLNIMARGTFRSCVAIDNSAVAIGRLSERIEETGLRTIVARRENVMEPSFAPESFDAIVGNSFLHHLPDNRRFLVEMHRLLRPGGTICFTGEPTVASNVLENIIMGTALRVLQVTGLKRRRNGNAKTVTDIWVYQEKKVRALLADCGYAEATITPFGVTVPLFNTLTAYLRTLASRPSLQPDLYWKLLGLIDRYAFFWLPADWHSHFVISARKQ